MSGIRGDFMESSWTVHTDFICAGKNAGMDMASSLVSAGRGWFQRRALFFKVIGVGFFALLLLIPLGMVHSVLGERQMRSFAAVASITETWGRSQRILGPVLVVPYTWKAEVEETTIVDGRRVKELKTMEYSSEAFFLPEQLQVAGDLEMSERKRGIYSVPVYSGKLKLSGTFTRPDFAFTGVKNPQPQWGQARVGFMLSDLRGAREALFVNWAGKPVALEPGAQVAGFTKGVSAAVTVDAVAKEQAFSLELTLNGSDALTVVPLGRQTKVTITSNWPDPSFMGAFLPVKREVGAEGFSAEWQVSYYGRDFPQQWTTRTGEHTPEERVFAQSEFGVKLAPAVSAYRTVERSIKYGVLFVALVFTVFFLFEAVCALKLNALNYLLVGAALCLFFLGLLALSEVTAFENAYAGAAIASTVLIGLYSWRVLGSALRAWLVSVMLGGVYAYLFFVLRMEDMSLVAGTAGLFVVLAAVMYATRGLRTEVKTMNAAAPAAG
ncbi:MAG: cell envelope integrity protein CreD [Nibricoccus sp.]